MGRSRFTSIKMTMTIYGLSIILLMTVLSVYSLTIMWRYKGQIETMFEKHLYLADIENQMVALDKNLLDFLSTKSSNKLNDFNIGLEAMTQLTNTGPEDLYTMEDVLMQNIVALAGAYRDQSMEAINYKRQRNVAKYYHHYEESKKIKGFLLDYIQELNRIQLNRNSKSYITLLGQIRLLQTVTTVIIFLLISLSLLVVYLITNRLVKPITNLSQAAEAIGAGEFNQEDVVVESDDEWMLLANAFNKMKNSIRSYIEALQQKAETETKLKDEQLKNIKMAHLLDNAKLYALQSQINPHFLFNTINAGVQLSVMERANRTGKFLDTMSSLFRYNIQKMDSTRTLAEELSNIEDYYNLLKVRFGKRIQFEFHIDEEVLMTKVPPLILQPLVENAYIHGLSSLEEGGKIMISSYKKDNQVLVVVRDTGKGMDQETMDRILARGEGDDSQGIGVRNVRDRLELFFHTTHIFRIESKIGAGTKIIMTLPPME